MRAIINQSRNQIGKASSDIRGEITIIIWDIFINKYIIEFYMMFMSNTVGAKLGFEFLGLESP